MSFVAAIAMLLVLAPAAGAVTFEVNSTADTADVSLDGVCDADAGAPVVCTLRAALAEAENTVASDDIRFDETAVMGQTITVVATFPAMTRPINLNGCLDPGEVDGGNPNSTQPCVGLRWDNAGTGLGTALNFNAGDADIVIRGIAFTRWSGAIRFSDLTVGLSSLEVQNNWFGTQLDGTTQEANSSAIAVGGDNATIGGDENGSGQTERNVFSNNTGTAIQIASADNVQVQGNYFGTTPSGTAASSPGNGENIEVIQTLAPMDDVPNNNTIGGTVTSGQAATPACDGVCNVIAGANGVTTGLGSGIDLQGESAVSEAPAGQTTIAGNFIGLAANGTAAIGNSTGVRIGTASDITIGGAGMGDPARDRNYVTGGSTGISTLGFSGGNNNLSIQNNFLGLRSDGTAALSPPATLVDLVVPAAGSLPTPPTFAGNRLAAATGGQGLILGGGHATGPPTTVTGNVFGVGVGGQNVGGGFNPVRIVQAQNVQLGGAAAGAGNTIGNSTGRAVSIEGSTNITVEGNFIGTDATDDPHPNTGVGIMIDEFFGSASTGNVIGGDTAAQENVVSNSGSDAIRIVHDTSDNNEIRRNHGSGTGDLFIDLNDDGPGNPGDVNGGVQPPGIDVANANAVSGTATSGSKVRVFAASSADGQDIASFLGDVTVPVSGTWTVTYGSPQADGQRVVATQTVPSSGTSELSGVATTDAVFPTTTIDDGPTGVTNDPTPTFAYSSNDATASFECSIDQGTPAFQPCPGTGTGTFTPLTGLADGAYTFRVRATDPNANTDQSPDTRGFTVDTVFPETTIDSGPSGTTNDPTPTFAYSSNDAAATFECSIDQGTQAFQPCPGTGSGAFTPLANLADGAYTFRVRATDPATNTDQSPETRGFTVDTAPPPSPAGDTDPPETTITGGPKDKTKKKTASFSFSSDEPGSTFECKLDDGGFESCASPLTEKVKRGKHTLEVRARDAAGNVDPTPATDDWKVKKKKK